jgi:hypothetical protein
MARITVQITTPSNNRITVSPGVSALSSVQLYLNELVDVDTSGGQDGYVLTQQADGSFAMEAIATRLSDLSDTNIVSPGPGDALVYDDASSKWVPGGVKSVNGQEGDVLISIPSPTPTPGVSGLADTNITNLQDDQIIRYDSASGKWLNEDLEALPAGGTTGQALVKATNTDYDVEWADIAIDVQYHNRYATTAETLRSGATETVELYFFAQADGNGLAESAESDTATTGYDIRRKLYYSEAAQADPDTGTWTQFADIADDTTYASAKATLLAHLKERTGGTVPISLKMTWEEVAEAPTFTGLLNETYGSGAAAAYSVRRLNGLYTGAAIQVERSSDNTTQDIGFDSNGDLDESALTTFCTGTTCKVRTWYDQSQTGGTGSGNDATQTDHANQPIIYTGGAIVKENGRAALSIDDGFMDAGSAISLTSDYFITSIFNTNSTQSFNMLLGSYNDTKSYLSLRTNEIKIRNAQSSINNFAGVAIGLAYNQRHLLTLSRASNSLQPSVDGNAHTAQTTSGTYNFDELFAYNSGLGSYRFGGNCQEIILYAKDQVSNRTDIEENVGDYFTQNTPLLDTYTGAAAAYSLRKLSSSYSGSAIRVRRASDNAETDIGFNVFGELDTVSLAAFCGSNDGFVKTWYDQSGSANDATQNTTAYQPKIVDNGTYLGELQYTIGDTHNINISSITTRSIFAVAETSALNGTFGVWGSLSGGNAFGLRETNKFYDNSNGISAISSAGLANLNQYYGFTSIINTAQTNNTIYVDGAQVATASGTATSSTLLEIARNSNVNWKELILYSTDESANRTNIEDNINTFYSIY